MLAWIVWACERDFAWVAWLLINIDKVGGKSWGWFRETLWQKYLPHTKNIYLKNNDEWKLVYSLKKLKQCYCKMSGFNLLKLVVNLELKSTFSKKCKQIIFC